MSSAPRTIEEVSDPFANFMINPATPGSGVCSTCWTFHDPSYSECYRCSRQPRWTDVVAPITYSIDREQMHHTLRNYKDGLTPDVRARLQLQLAAVLWRFLRAHEQCVAEAAGTSAFKVVTVVPSGTVARDNARPRLREIVGATSARFERLLAPTESTVPGHQYDANRYRGLRPLDGTSVLLIDDTWTTGASVQTAAGALKAAGATRVGAVVIGRHIRLDWDDNAERLKALPRPFDWTTARRTRGHRHERWLAAARGMATASCHPRLPSRVADIDHPMAIGCDGSPTVHLEDVLVSH